MNTRLRLVDGWPVRGIGLFDRYPRYTQSFIVVLIALVLISYSSLAESKKNWFINPGITVSETYSENIAPASDELDEADFITQITPTLQAQLNGRRIQANLDWRLENILYAKNDNDSTFQSYLANVAIEALSEHFFVDLASTFSQRIINTNGVRVNNNYNITNNRTNQLTSSIRPYWYQPIGPYTEAIIDVEYGGILLEDGKGGAAAISDSQLYSSSFLLRNKLDNQRFLWKLNAQVQRIQYDDTSFDELKISKVGLLSGYQISSGFSPLIVVGYEKNDFGNRIITNDPEDVYWALGFLWRPNARSSLETLAGHRYFGTTYRAKWTQRGKYFTSRLTYKEEIEGEILSALRGVSFIDNPSQASANLSLTSDVYVSKTARASILFNKSKITFSITPFHEQREFNDQTQNERIRGIDTKLNWAFTPQTTFNLSLHWDRTNSKLGGEKRTYFVSSAQLQRKLGKFSVFSIEYSLTKADNDFKSYEEKAITAALTHWFGNPPPQNSEISPRKTRSKQYESVF